ncbi:MAG: D-tyrosyl-tRNA(Tyr) deacylase [Dehalococcoidia bacterium]|nr:D-tyrosyl-tRNA(Tyr) deacylase [Dehalococcoidia bacterium]
MKAIIQRVSSGSVEVEKKIVGSINQGLVVLLGITHNDNNKDIDYMIQKILNLRIFGDENTDNFERSILDIQGELLIISQFTLYGETKKGRRPSFINSAKSEFALEIYNKFLEKIKEEKIKIETGIFGAKMRLNIVNEGPVTLILDSN